MNNLFTVKQLKAGKVSTGPLLRATSAGGIYIPHGGVIVTLELEVELPDVPLMFMLHEVVSSSVSIQVDKIEKSGPSQVSARIITDSPTTTSGDLILDLFAVTPVFFRGVPAQDAPQNASRIVGRQLEGTTVSLTTLDAELAEQISDEISETLRSVDTPAAPLKDEAGLKALIKKAAESVPGLSDKAAPAVVHDVFDQLSKKLTPAPKTKKSKKK